MKHFPPHFELVFEAVRSRGPGGQNVNKTNSAAVLRWNLPATSLPVFVRDRLIEKLGPKLTAEGDLIVRSETQRDLEANKKDCVRKLRELIDKALFVPKKRIKTKPGRAAKEKRLTTKKHQGEKKRNRSSQWD